jgi:hypothetical protein
MSVPRKRTGQSHVVSIDEGNMSEDETRSSFPPLKGGGKGGDLAAVACMLVCLSILVIGLAAPTLYFAFEDENSTCQKGTRGGLNLSDWLKGAGFSDVITLFFVWVMMLLAAGLEFDPSGPAIILTLLAALFKVMWWIWGVVILATAENNHCVAEGKGMAVMAIIWLVLSWGSLGAGKSGGGGD